MSGVRGVREGIFAVNTITGAPEYVVEIRKWLTFAVMAETADEARALAVLAATGTVPPTMRARVRFQGRRLAVESCRPPEGPDGHLPEARPAP